MKLLPFIYMTTELLLGMKMSKIGTNGNQFSRTQNYLLKLLEKTHRHKILV